jgi:NADPH:quinone reductase-like Zn-dependent oxidoreductase
VLLQGLTVATFVEEAYKVKKGDIILVHTIAGGVGLLFAQLLHHIGATVIGTTSTPEKAELAKKNGADHVILYRSENTVQRVLDLTEQPRVSTPSLTVSARTRKYMREISESAGNSSLFVGSSKISK